MDKENNLEVFNLLVDFAHKNQHHEFELVCNFNEFKAVRYLRQATRKTVGIFQDTLDIVYQQYLDNVDKVPVDNSLDFVLSLRDLIECKRFYEDELAIVDRMIEEFIMYLRFGNFFKTLLHGRPVEDQVNYLDIINKNSEDFCE